ncbi:hypothetical protein DFJ73DRAFT_536248 [Zopfochytrium polystomum]|nr:hypothetical protein DFJ73DRAFT_536248 [Zopfochytrium polystomum]
MSSGFVVPPEVVAAGKDLRFRKGRTMACLIIKLDPNTLQASVQQRLDDCTVEDLQEELPDSSPRLIVISYELKHEDGRVSFPLIGIYYLPPNASDKLRMVYASGQQDVFRALDIVKVYDITDTDDLSDAWLQTLKAK